MYTSYIYTHTPLWSTSPFIHSCYLHGAIVTIFTLNLCLEKTYISLYRDKSKFAKDNNQ